jgi:HK97 family phage portal protein
VNKIGTALARMARPLVVKAYDLNSAFLAGQPMPWSSGYAGGVNIADAYANSSTAYSCIRRKAQDIASAPLIFKTRDEPDAPEVREGDPVRALFKRPLGQFSTEQFIQFCVTFLEMRGEFFVDFDDPERPRAMVPFYDPIWWTAITAEDGFTVAGWTMRQRQTALTRMASDVLHHRYIAPGDPYRGQSPLRAAAKNYAIETGGESLQSSIVERGGETAILYEVPVDTTPEQRRQILEQLRSRRARSNEVGRDVLLPTGVKVIDPRFIREDFEILAAMPKSEEKICDVYGVAPSLLHGTDDNYATFRGRMRIYWSSTLVPCIRGIEGAFDSYFAERFGVFVRFDLSRIEALKENFAEQVDVAGKLFVARVPWRVINERLDLGLDVDDIPEADDVLTSSASAPASKLIEEWSKPVEPAPMPPAAPPVIPPTGEGDGEQALPPAASDYSNDGGEGKSAPARPRPSRIRLAAVNLRMRQRATDPRETISRTRRLAKLERETRGEWRELMSDFKGKAVRAAKKHSDDHGSLGMRAALDKMKPLLKERAVALLDPKWRSAAREGKISVLVITEKIDFSEEQGVRETKAVGLSSAARDWIKARANLVEDMADEILDEVLAGVERIVAEGLSTSELANFVAEVFDQRAARAMTIARTEVGSAYNVSRYSEMKDQGFTAHEWLTAEDELVRDEHALCDGEVVNVGETFKCGLAFPMEEGGEAWNVINCRCSTIPVMPEEE